MIQKFSLESNVLFGRGSVATLLNQLAARGFRKPAVVVDEVVAGHGPYAALEDSLRTSGASPEFVFHARADVEPTYAYLDEAAAAFRAVDFDVLLGVGGGSILDLAKGIAILCTNSGSGIDYRGMDMVEAPGVPLALVPTTAGTGSEATHTASFIDSDAKVKLGINGRHVGCMMAALDPVFVATCPRGPTIAAGLDALVHAVEAVSTRTANHVSVLFGVEAVRLIFRGLPASVLAPENLSARADVLLGSHYAGLAMWNAGGGPASGISYPLGVHWGVPHGWAGGLLLPHVVAANVAAGYVSGYAQIRARMGELPVPSDPAAQAIDFSARLLALLDEVDAPSTFRQFGVGREHASEIVRLTLEERRENLDLNPIAFGELEVSELIDLVLD